MLLDSNYRRSVDNWRSWVAFFTEQVRSVVSVKSMRNHIGRLDATKRQMLRSLIDDQLESPGPSGTLYSGMLRQIRTSGKITFFHAVAANYKAGRLIIFEIDQAEDGASAHFSKRRIQHSIRAVRRYHRPVKVPVYILGAALHRPDRLKSEMLDDAFAAMTHRVWSQCLSIIENHGGVFGKHAGGGCYGHFLPQGTPDDTALRAIRCSLDIASSMEGISREYKLRRVWPHEIQLNIGLHRERGYVGALNTATGEVLSSTGDGLGLAARLSEIGDRGQILATKSFFDQLSAAVLDRLRFGVYRGAGGPRGAFSPGGFLPLDAINGERRTGAADRKLRGVSVTQIFDLHQ